MFIFLCLILFPLINWYSKFETKRINYCLILVIIYLLCSLCYGLLGIIIFIILYESLTLILFLLLFIFLSSYYRIKTTFYYYIFTILGTMFFILMLLIMISSNFVISLLVIIPFFIKIPTFPFIYWLPEVHSESNTSISLYLAGILLKISLYGLLRFVISSYIIALRYMLGMIISIVSIGIIFATFSLYRYYDLKRIIAFHRFCI